MTKDDVTLFLITTGEPSTSTARKALETQAGGPYKIDVIRDVRPMSAAFNEMIDRCKTPFFVQVDADMVLRPLAVQKLMAAMEVSSDDVAFVGFPLTDTHLKRPICGVKIYRKSAMKLARYSNVRFCEMDQLHKLKQQGYRHEVYWPEAPGGQVDTLGEHRSCQTNQAAFERYRDLFLRFKYPGMEWLVPEAKKLIAGMESATATARDGWAYAGMVAGLSEAYPRGDVERGAQTAGDLWRALSGLR